MIAFPLAYSFLTPSFQDVGTWRRGFSMYRDYFGQLYISVSHVQQDPLAKKTRFPAFTRAGQGYYRGRLRSQR